MNDSTPDDLSRRVYPEFDGQTGEEIQIKLKMLNQLLDAEIQSELKKEKVRKTFSSLKNRQEEEKYSKKDKKEDTPPSKRKTIYLDLPDLFVIAHRGWSGSYPENTLIGMREAIRLGCHMIEFDISFTKDRRAIIFHDDTLDRVTNSFASLSDCTYNELRKIDVGSWFHPKYAGTRMPSLEEILLIAKGSGIMVNIEIKVGCWEDEEKGDNVEYQIAHAVRKFKVEDRVLVSSFKWDFIKRIHRVAPEIKTALLHRKDVGKLDPFQLKETYGCSSFNLNIQELTQKFVNKCHDAKLKIFTYTVNSYTDMETCLHMNIDGIITNHPNRLFRFLKKHQIRKRSLDIQEKEEDLIDVRQAIQKLELDEIEKARKRARWRAKRLILDAQKKNLSSQVK